MAKRILTKQLYNGSFLPEWLSCRSKKEISDGAKLLYARLHRYIGENGVCWPTISKLAKDLGKGDRQVDRLLKELKDLNLIEGVQVGKKCANRYYLLDHIWMSSCFGVTTEMSYHDKSVTTLVSYPMETTEVSCPQKVSQERGSIKVNGQMTQFDLFWKSYPNKVKKKTALQKWLKLKLDDKKSRSIIEHVEERKKKDPNWLSGYIPHPTTFLNQELWNDEYSRNGKEGTPKSKGDQFSKWLKDAVKETKGSVIDV